MAPRYPVPIQEDVRDLLTDLLGRGIAVDKTRALEFGAEDVGLVAVYIDDDDELAELVICDAAFGVLVGAALVMVPARVAKGQVAAGTIDADSVEYAREVANILARILNTPRSPHVRLSEVIVLPAELDEPVAKLLAAPEFRRDFIVTIEEYGEGRMSILVS